MRVVVIGTGSEWKAAIRESLNAERGVVILTEEPDITPTDRPLADDFVVSITRTYDACYDYIAEILKDPFDCREGWFVPLSIPIRKRYPSKGLRARSRSHLPQRIRINE